MLQVIWPFTVGLQHVRLHIEVSRDQAAALRQTLDDAAMQSATSEGFVRLAVVAIRQAGGTVGDVLTGQVPSATFRTALRGAMRAAVVTDAAERLLQSAHDASVVESERLLTSPEWQVERDYLFSVWLDLDEHGDPFVELLATRLGVDSERLRYVLGILDYNG